MLLPNTDNLDASKLLQLRQKYEAMIIVLEAFVDEEEIVPIRRYVEKLNKLLQE